MKKYLLIILALSIATHFAFFGHPNQTVFDEVHFGKFISGYYTHEYYFDIHPPLGKLMIAGFAKIFDFKPEFSFAQIGDKFPDNKYLALRFLPSLAGALLPVVIFLLALQLKFKPQGAFIAGLLVVFENALLVQTHYILMDGFLLLFGFSALLFYFKSRHSPFAIRYSLLMAVFGGLAASIKWTGLTFLALPFFIEAFYLSRGILRMRRMPLLKLWQLIFYFAVIPFVIYFSIFALHFSFLTKSGSGDAFMKPTFHRDNVVTKFFQLNAEMYRSNQRLTATHPYGSSWYSWPLMTRPIFYWVSGDSRIYLLGNPVIWWASTVAIMLLLLQNLKFKIFNLKLNIAGILLGGYFLNLIPFIGITRVMFLYHYLTGLIFAILILVYLIEKQDGSTPFDKTQGKWLNTRKIFIGLTIASILAFIYFAPLTYGLSLSPKAYNARVWLPSWR
ncbi:MAG: phospholipid carrier-dependent glycosyltransferase [Candidatus Yanofskybacteria bacterium]|nr:phospholipid carrier-dependent glycosyltransferase [Candidatus Yanofskybacteria bacterium]